MHIALAGPIALDLLEPQYWSEEDAPATHAAPITAFLANALLRRGHRVSVFTTSWSATAPYSFVGDHLSVHVVPVCRAHPRRDYLRRERHMLTQLIRASGADVVNAQWSYEFALAALATGMPTIVSLRDHAGTVLRHSRDALRLYRWLINEVVVQRAAHLSANSEYLWSRLARRVRAKTRVLSNFLPEESFADDGADRASGPQHRLITVSNGFSPYKNVGSALLAFGELRRRRPDATYTLVGKGMEPGGLAARFAERHGVAEAVRFAGPWPYADARAELSHSTVLVHPSLEESFGMTPLEAMAAGVPVVAGAASGNLPYLLEHGRCGRLCDASDPAAIARATEAVLHDPAEAGLMARAAHDHAATHYSEHAVLPALVRYYAAVARA